MRSIPNPRMETVGFERGHLLDFYDLFSGGSFSRKYTFMLNTPKTSTSTLKLLCVAIRSQQLRLWLQIDWPPPPAVYIRAFYVRHLSQIWLVCWQVISIRKIMKHPDHPGPSQRQLQKENKKRNKAGDLEEQLGNGTSSSSTSSSSSSSTASPEQETAKTLDDREEPLGQREHGDPRLPPKGPPAEGQWLLTGSRHCGWMGGARRENECAIWKLHHQGCNGEFQWPRQGEADQGRAEETQASPNLHQLQAALREWRQAAALSQQRRQCHFWWQKRNSARVPGEWHVDLCNPHERHEWFNGLTWMAVWDAVKDPFSWDDAHETTSW